MWVLPSCRPGSVQVIPQFHHHILGENVLAVKEDLQVALHLVQRPSPSWSAERMESST